MEKLATNYPVTMAWRSYMLRPPGSPPIPAEYRARIQSRQADLIAMARQQYGLELKPGPFGIDSYPALVLAKFAEAQGKGEAFHKAVFKAYWLQGRSIEEKEVLGEVLAEVGLAATDLESALANPAYHEAVAQDFGQAQEYQLSGVPALVFNDKYLVVGAQPYPVFEQVVAKLQEEPS